MLSAIDPGSAGAGAIAVTAIATVALAAFKLVGARNGKPLPPGSGVICREHGESIATSVAYQKIAQQTLKRLEGKIDAIAAGRHVYPPANDSDP